jgi:hypothetical protein
MYEQCRDFSTKLNVQLIACRFENIIRQALGIKHTPAYKGAGNRNTDKASMLSHHTPTRLYAVSTLSIT